MWYTAGADWGPDYIAEKILSSDFKIAGSIPASEYTEEFTYEGETELRKGTEVFFVSGGNGYRIYAESPIDEYNTYSPVFSYIINSFRITEVASSKLVWETQINEKYSVSVMLPHDWGAVVYDDGFESIYGDGIVRMYSPGEDSSGGLMIKKSEGASLDEMNKSALAAFKDYYLRY